MNSLTQVTLGALAGFAGVETASYFLHRYVFHGVLWKIHRTHHLPRRGALEWNDLFSFGFAAAAVGLMTSRPGPDFIFGVGAGISIYGTLYFVLHDLYTHGRGLRFESGNRLLNLVRRAHRRHHQTATQPGQEPFGLLVFDYRRFREEPRPLREESR